ncbi:hypothetical protein PIB30_075708 [Stylosanthes scabra]|uniref:Uncharacterized protein n=1 Tax=Stylosanthes scabra TaxID=79078 RepID=A0ABU6YNV4_9FABA|nr:hypothetical protein [Stylosanthes scabra]
MDVAKVFDALRMEGLIPFIPSGDGSPKLAICPEHLGYLPGSKNLSCSSLASLAASWYQGLEKITTPSESEGKTESVYRFGFSIGVSDRQELGAFCVWVRAGLEVTVVNLSRNGRLRGFATTFDFKLRFTPLNRSMDQNLKRGSCATVLTLAYHSLEVVYGDLSTSSLYVYNTFLVIIYV